MAVIANLVVLTLPAVLVVLFGILTPTYMTPMFRDPLGIVLLTLGAMVMVLGYGATYLAVRLLRAGQPVWLFLLVIAATLLSAFPAVWVVLLGPALLIFLHAA